MHGMDGFEARRFRWVVWLCVFALGCGADTPPPPPTRGPIPVSDLLRCDITQRDCQEAIYASVAERLESDPSAPPPIRTISVEEYEAELREFFVPEDYANAEPVTRGLRLMGLLAEEAPNLIDAQIENLVSWVGAYFDSQSGGVTVIDRDYEVISGQALLAHEFVHAIQERDFGFDVINEGVEFEDHFLASRAVVEGDADHNSIAWTLEKLETPLTAVDWAAYHDDNKELLRQSISSTDRSVIDFGASFPYVHGGEFMTDAILTDGLDVRRELWNAGPATSAAVMSGYAAFRDGTVPAHDAPESAYPTASLEFDEVVRDELGAWTLFVFLHHFGIGQDLAWDAALASTGDAFAVYENETETVAVWRLRVGPTELDVASIVAQALDLSLRSAAWTSFAEGDDVVIVAAETQMALDDWLAGPMEALASRVVAKRARRGLPGVLSKGTCVKSRRDVGARFPQTMP
jgi:hypothetical protein